MKRNEIREGRVYEDKLGYIFWVLSMDVPRVARITPPHEIVKQEQARTPVNG